MIFVFVIIAIQTHGDQATTMWFSYSLFSFWCCCFMLFCQRWAFEDGFLKQKKRVSCFNLWEVIMIQFPQRCSQVTRHSLWQRIVSFRKLKSGGSCVMFFWRKKVLVVNLQSNLVLLFHCINIIQSSF